ncbi:DNA polymerase III subunit gamma/tau [Antarcticibacterium flavum]|uniref:DNA polymerase III subunit gamma/tau n=1 Tax=Antarcticibacterium flavum TaxID=2058175 RepID=A0A5B7WZ68_9FLAO|nr:MULTISPECIES: DNA polymerase III subunit gamma/tau [Antarcticibacterium]MCM4159031.1 DNA polymerase III subunit gamma/tau [Antarcticibacterium sp. W02-3]QCY68275.1 DNA polymerase III subunit gamma/tau [Antarcticibacterium flavum]
MEHFVVSARKYRPQTFKDVVGQQAITNTLLNAINHDHLAQALLFTGPRGVGKTTCARILAKMINHDGTQQPDEDFAFNIFELDAASNNSVDDIRNLIDQVRIPPQVGKYKVYIIDEVHMLSASAFNAFLKTLEEPPKHAIFILATTEKHKIIPTILSRCQIFDFKRITVTDARNYLAYIAEQEGVEAEEDALHIIAQKADGAMRDALSIYDRVVSFSGANLTRQAVTENLNVLDYETYLNVTNLILENNIPQLLVEYNEILARGFDGHHFIAGLASHFRDLLVCRNPKTISLLEVGENTKTSYYEQAQKTSEAFLMQGIELANECDLKYKSSRNQRLLVELCLMQLASITFDGEKKKPEQFIIPAQNYKNFPPAASLKLSSEEKVVVRDNEYGQGNSAPKPEVQVPDTEFKTERQEDKSSPVEGLPDPEKSTCRIEEAPVEAPAENPAPSPAPAATITSKEKVSGLSLASIRKKKELLAKQQGHTEKTVEEKNEKFNETQLHAAWDDYIHRLKNKGEKILASIMETDMPKLEGTAITIELPADTMRKDLERGMNPLMGYLKKKLQNTFITLDIQVNETKAKQYAFTNIEKYNKLKEKNPLIEKLRTTFDLDL